MGIADVILNYITNDCQGKVIGYYMSDLEHELATSKATNAYHHGDLRSALITATREALLHRPPDAITMKFLASQLGVSQPAPYRHFKSRDALLSAVAADGFTRLNEALSVNREGHTSGTENDFRTLCESYIEFAFGNLGVYRLMHSRAPMTSVELDSELARTADASFKLLISRLPSRETYQQAATLAVFVWSTLHGIITLQGEGFVDGALEGSVPLPDVILDVISKLMAVVF